MNYSQISLIDSNITDKINYTAYVIYQNLNGKSYFPTEVLAKLNTLKVAIPSNYYDSNFKPEYKALYNSKTHVLTIIPELFNLKVAIHELLHILTNNFNNQLIGYKKDISYNYFNEAATEWLTLKILNLSLDQAEQSYLEIVKFFDNLVQKFGEEKIFSYFFLADYESFEKQFTDLDDMIYLRNTINSIIYYDANCIKKVKK